MKLKLFSVLALCLSVFFVWAQNNVGINTSTPHLSSALTVDTSAAGPQGILIPRMTQARRNAIASPATGLMVFQTDNTPGFYYYDGTAWTAVGGASSSGVKLELVAKKMAATQTLSNANGTNTGDVVVFDNVAVTPTSGSYNASINAYTAGSAGLYFIQVKFSAVPNATPTNTTTAWPYVEVNGTSLSTNNVYAPYISSGGGGNNLATGYKGLSSASFMLYLNTGDYIKIRGLNENSSVTNTLNNDGGCQLMVVKMN